MTRLGCFAAGLLCCLVGTGVAGTTVFFDTSQSATLVNSGVTSDTIRSNGYLFTYTRDKLFTGGTGQIIGRPVRVPWPTGIEAQAVTTPPPGVTDHKARLTIKRVDGKAFDLTAFTAKLLANTGGAGATIEIMPQLDGEDGFPDPLYFDATGYYGATFSYNTSPNYWGSTALLTGFDTYNVSLYVDYAFIALTLKNNIIAADFDNDLDVDRNDASIQQLCAAGPETPVTGACLIKDLDFDDDVDLHDLALLQCCCSGDGNPADPNCG